MREKPGGAGIDVSVGNMSRVETGRTYGLVDPVYNTIGNLLTQDDQVRCFENAAHRRFSSSVACPSHRPGRRASASARSALSSIMWRSRCADTTR